MIKSFSKEREIFLIIDLHGHSRKMNSFFYGCNYKEDAILTRFFPYLMSKNSEYISMKDCRFSMSKCKEKTARISLWKELKIPNIFTLESSFYGMRKEARNVHYTI